MNLRGIVFLSLFCFARCYVFSQSVEGILGNRGDLTTVFINDLKDSTPGSDSGDLPCVLAGQNLEVCLVRNIMCSSTSASSSLRCQSVSFANSISSNSDSVQNLFKSDINFSNWIEVNSPLNLNGEYTLLNFDSLTIDFSKLKPEERWDLLQLLENDLDSLNWDSSLLMYHSRDKSVTITSQKKDSLASRFSKSFSKVVIDGLVNMPLVQSDFKTVQCFGSNSTYLAKTRMIRWNVVCPGIAQDNCRQIITEHISRFAQDDYVTREGGQLFARSRPNRDSLYRGRLQRYANEICNSDSLKMDLLHLNGGNHFVRDSVIFIGRSDLKNLKICSNWWHIVGSTSCPTDSLIETWLKNIMLPNLTKSHIVWIGDSSPIVGSPTECNEIAFRGEHQPLYHIDLFFHPVGVINDSSNNEFYYLMATLDDRYHNKRHWSIENNNEYDSLKKKLVNTELTLRKRLDSIGFTPKPILIPLLVGFNDNDMNYISFINGHSSVTSTGAKFYLPDYSSPAFNSRKYQLAKNHAVNDVEKDGNIEVILIKELYATHSALHCIVKEVERSQP